MWPLQGPFKASGYQLLNFRSSFKCLEDVEHERYVNALDQLNHPTHAVRKSINLHIVLIHIQGHRGLEYLSRLWMKGSSNLRE